MAVRENGAIGFEARRGGTLLTKASFRYDAFNRRVASFADTDGDASDDVVTYSVYGGQAAWQLLAEYDGADDTANLLRSFVYGLYIDEVLSMRDHGSEEDFFYHQDDLFSVYALTDGDGAVVERYDYGDYGQVSIMAGDGTPRAESAYGNRHAFTGRLLDQELTLDDGGQVLQYRFRYVVTVNGRFLQRDPLGSFDSDNVYVYAVSAPYTGTDASGLCVTRGCASSGPVPPNISPNDPLLAACGREVNRQIHAAGFANPQCREEARMAGLSCCQRLNPGFGPPNSCDSYHNGFCSLPYRGYPIRDTYEKCMARGPASPSPTTTPMGPLPLWKIWACSKSSVACQAVCTGSTNWNATVCQDMCACTAGKQYAQQMICNTCCAQVGGDEAAGLACNGLGRLIPSLPAPRP